MIAVNERNVCRLLNWDEGQYHQFLFDCGMAWLAQHYAHNKMLGTALGQSRIFWKWWRNEFDKIDEHFIISNQQCISKSENWLALETYVWMHNANRVESRPYDVIINNAWDEYYKANQPA